MQYNATYQPMQLIQLALPCSTTPVKQQPSRTQASALRRTSNCTGVCRFPAETCLDGLRAGDGRCFFDMSQTPFRLTCVQLVNWGSLALFHVSHFV